MSVLDGDSPPRVVFRDRCSVDLVQHVGGDLEIVRAARVSVGKAGDESPAAVAGLVRYLMKHRHGSPFEHGSLTVRVECPIFVAREWMRHRVGWSYNEVSGRYSQLRPVFWLPPEGRPTVEPPAFKPARPILLDDPVHHGATAAVLRHAYAAAWGAYRALLDAGAAREVARAVLPVGVFTSFVATANPRSLMHFLSLRTRHPAAAAAGYPMAEIAQAADDLERIAAGFWPETFRAFTENGRVAP